MALHRIKPHARSSISNQPLPRQTLAISAASRFSFLLSIPIIIAATTLILYELITSTVAVEWSVLLGGTMVAGLSAYYCIHYFLAFINRIGMVPFVIYRLVLGCTLLFVIYG